MDGKLLRKIIVTKTKPTNMTTKTTNILYWVFTIIFAGLMIFSGVPNVGPDEQSIEMFHKGLGYPIYFIQFIGVAKILGSIAILIPGLNKSIKEWAYAGLFFDLLAAVYSGIAVANGKADPAMIGMLIWIVPGILSYIFWKKKLKTEGK
jgi:hypothetical protein